MTKSRGIGRGGARPGSGRKWKAITLRLAALKNALAALLSSEVSNFREADRRFVRAMIALGATNNATAVAFGISEAELLAKFPDELECRTGETIQLLTNPNVTNWQPAQPVDATQALNLSAGVSNCKVSRGRSLS